MNSRSWLELGSLQWGRRSSATETVYEVLSRIASAVGFAAEGPPLFSDGDEINLQ